MTTLEEVEIGLGGRQYSGISAVMIEEVVVGLVQVQELVLIETELDALSVGNIIILLKTVQLCN